MSMNYYECTINKMNTVESKYCIELNKKRDFVITSVQKVNVQTVVGQLVML